MRQTSHGYGTMDASEDDNVNDMRRNKTRIIFNQKYKNIVSEARAIHVSYQKLIDEDTAALLREYLDMKYTNLDICTYGKFTKPDYYAFIISLCFEQSVLEEYDSWEDLSEIRIQRVDILPHSYDTQCCCGQHITQVFKFDGGYTCAIVGNVCVEKSEISNSSVLEDLCQLKKENRRKKKSAKLAEEDKKQEWYKYEKRCLGTNDRICNSILRRTVEHWRVRCITCHKKYSGYTKKNTTKKNKTDGILKSILEKYNGSNSQIYTRY